MFIAAHNCKVLCLGLGKRVWVEGKTYAILAQGPRGLGCHLITAPGCPPYTMLLIVAALTCKLPPNCRDYL